jgi:CRP-like cAMP-binding protein
MALFENDLRSATITASEDCLLFEVKRNDFESLCKQHPLLGYKLVKKIAAVLCERVRKGNQDILKLSTALSIALSRT